MHACMHHTHKHTHTHTHMQVQDFINKTSGPGNLYGLQPETLASLMLSLLPPLTHSYKPLEKSIVMNGSLDLKILLMQELLQNLRHCAGLHIPPVSTARLMALLSSY